MGKDKRVGIINSIRSPLAFFVLALLIVEAFLGTILIGSNIDQSLQRVCVWAGILMFTGVVVLVFLLVWFKPTNLIYDTEAALKARH